ncbi:hypothetical protein K431DRAFT_282773 [Polychaeton citri CBS 116435]|uniref:Exosome complex protein n=1 Tax=Polychaeton citri CBS 116435 TaxID=1314669 RepID=A0A9P4UT25_9PEZI|nr:hypothetical protein K431DRAFT_282773 [Polychaeton citri CBS 116435]
MDTEDILEQVSELTGNIDDLERSLQPLLAQTLSASTSKLPLLDKAKLYVLATYALDSILFSALRLNGTDTKSHPVFLEINRVKEYFGKIKSAETTGSRPNARLDKDAAARFVRAGLSGNDRYDIERRERVEKEKAGAKRKLEEIATGTHTRFDGAARRIKAAEDGGAGIQEEGQQSTVTPQTQAPTEAESQSVHLTKEQKKELKRQRRMEKKLARLSPAVGVGQEEYIGAGRPEATAQTQGTQQQSNPAGTRSGRATFEALLKGPLPQAEDTESRSKKRKGRGGA